VTRASAYSQIVVKAGVERSYLISAERLKSFAECKNLDELISRLNGTPYENLLKNVKQPTAEELQHVFKEELMRVCIRMVSFSPKGIQGFLKRYVSRFEIENIKSLLRAKNARLPYETLVKRLNLSIEDVFGKRELFIHAVKAEDVKGVIEAFRETVYAPVLLEGISGYEATRSTKLFDLSLDRTYYDDLLDSFKTLSQKDYDIASSCLGPEVDSFNIVTIIRSKLLGYPPHWIYRAITHHFHKLSEGYVRALVSSEDINSTLNLLNESFYGKFLASQERTEETVISFEKAIKRFSLEQLHKTRIADPFNVATPLSVIMRKENEVENLTIISSAIECGWKPEDTFSFLL